MKEVYSFIVERSVKSSKPVITQTASGAVESFEESSKEITNRIYFVKPSIAFLEEAEFFYGQKFNEYINSGFLTRSMLSKRMGDMGGFASKLSLESLQKAISDNIEASRVIEFYGGASDLSLEQKQKLREAEASFVETQTSIIEYEEDMRSQFSQTADVKAEQRLIEWLVFHLSFFEEEVDGKKQSFPLFKGDSFDEKKSMYLALCEDASEITDHNLFKVKSIFDKSFETLVRVASIWYNKMADTQEGVQSLLDGMFSEPKETATEKKVKPPRKAAAKKRAPKKKPDLSKDE